MNFDLNQKQLEAVNSISEKVLIIAPAGSGKTSTLIAAIKKYKKENADSNVAAITFTKKSADDLKEKLKNYPDICPSTIHSWAYQELEKLSEAVRKEDEFNGFKIKLLQDEKIKEILEDLLRKRAYSYVKIDILFSYIMGNYNMDITDKLRAMFQAVERDYIEYKEHYNLYDFTDLPKYLLDKLNDYDRRIENMDALFVDEFQDVDDVQLELFERVDAAKKFYIGDPQQSIYIFRGATEDVMKKLRGFTMYNLDINYRSNQEILDFATTYQETALLNPIMFSGQLESYRSSILAEKGEGGIVYILNRTGSAYKVNEYIKERGEKIVQEFLEKDAMILCRKNKEVKAIKDLGYAKAQTIHQAKGLEYEHVIVTDFEVRGIEDINISYVAMTRAEKSLLAANYSAFLKIMEKLAKENKVSSSQKLF
jgi:superfamily I DNA/RNA helicase